MFLALFRASFISWRGEQKSTDYPIFAGIMMAYPRWILVFFLILSEFDLVGGIVASSLESRIKLKNSHSKLIFNDALTDFAGTLIVPDGASNVLQGRTIQYNSGRIEAGLMRGCLQGGVDPAALGTLSLVGGCSFVGDKGASLLGVSVSGSNNRLSGSVSMLSSLNFLDENSSLELGIDSCLSRDVALNGGSLRLFSNLALSQGVVIRGGGSVDVAGHALTLQSGNVPFANALVWSGSANLFLYDKVIISGSWDVGVVNPVVLRINGFGNELDLSLGGTITVQPGCSLILEDIVLTGLGSSGGTILLQDETSSLVFVGCIIKLQGEYAVNAGRVFCAGRDSTLITGSNECIFGGNSCLVIDGITLYYDLLASSQVGGINVLAPSNLSELNQGRVLSVHKKQADARLIIDDASMVCSGRLDLTVDSPMLFRGRNSTNIELVGSDLFVTCVSPGSVSKPPLMFVADHKRAIMRDIIVNNFDPACISCGVGAKLSFGDNVELNLTQSIHITNTLNIVGDVIVRGEGSVVDCSNGGVISVASGASLTLQDLVLSGIGNGFGLIVLADSTSTLYLKNVTMSLASSYTQTSGMVCFSGTRSVIITGDNILSFTDSACCVVDGVRVTYDSLGFPDRSNVQPSHPDGINLIYRKNGSCAPTDVMRDFESLDIWGASYQLQRNESLSLGRKLCVFCNDSVCVVKGLGYGLSLPLGVDGVIQIPSEKRLELQDIVLKGFCCGHLSFGVNSTMAFGDNVTIVLSDDLVITKDLTISGSVVMDCSGHRILFREGSGFVIEDGAYLELCNGFLLDLHDSGNPIKMASISSKLVLHDMACSLLSDFTIAQGMLDIVGNTYFSTHRNSFVYTSLGALTIRQASSLLFDEESVFRYDAKDGAKKLVFYDRTSSLSLDSAILSVGYDGLDLDAGTLSINGISVVHGDPGLAAHGIHFNSHSFDTNIFPKATLDLRGLIVND